MSTVMNVVTLHKAQQLNEAENEATPTKQELTPTPVDVAAEIGISKPLSMAKHSLATRFEPFLQWVFPPLMGLGLLLAIWAVISAQSQGLPGPIKTFYAAVELFKDPFYINGPNDQGIGWNILASLKRVSLGFGMAAIVGIPFGFMIGRFAFLSRMTAPIISLLRPVSPLAWLPIGLHTR